MIRSAFLQEPAPYRRGVPISQQIQQRTRPSVGYRPTSQIQARMLNRQPDYVSALSAGARGSALPATTSSLPARQSQTRFDDKHDLQEQSRQIMDYNNQAQAEEFRRIAQMLYNKQ